VAAHDKDDVFSFADNMFVIQKGKALASGPPNLLFKSPKHPSVAAFFSEYSFIDGHIYYAHQIKLVAKGALGAEVVKSYYKGPFFLIEATYDGGTLFFEHNQFIPPNTLVFLSLEKSA
jgi:ABC-type Fe3+/spermidine/putrescine transport system ATPase subunit